MLKKIIREPLLHFLLIGAALFAVNAAIHQGQGPQAATESSMQITITQGILDNLRENWRMMWLRPPTDDEMKWAVNEYIREEILRREAVSMGLDRDDAVIRHRLALKFEFINENLAAIPQAPPGEIEAFYEKHRRHYQAPARLSFVHIYFNTEIRYATAQSDAKEALTKLHTEAGNEKTQGMGDVFLMGYEFLQKTPEGISQFFGRPFADALVKIEPGSWQGPLASNYGWHLVKVTERTDPRPLAFSAVKDQVMRDWWEAERQKKKDENFKQLLARYTIVNENK